MSVYVTGDCHGGFQRFTPENFPKQKGMGREDCMIITGDCGGVWAGEQADGHRLDWLEDRPFTSSAHALYPLPRRKRQGSLTPLSLLSPRDPLRWARAGFRNRDRNGMCKIAAKPSAAGLPRRRGARERAQLSP